MIRKRYFNFFYYCSLLAFFLLFRFRPSFRRVYEELRSPDFEIDEIFNPLSSANLAFVFFVLSVIFISFILLLLATRF